MSHVMGKRWTLVIMTLVLVLAAIPLFSACGGDDDDEDTTTGATNGEVKEKDFVIGYLTTVFDSPDQMDQSIWMAADEINNAGGIQIGDTVYKIKIKYEDDMKTNSGAVAGIQKLLYDDHADWIVSTAFNGNEVIMPYVDEVGVIAFAWTGPQIWLGLDKPYHFHTYADERLFNIIPLDWVRQNRPDVKKIEIVNLNLGQFRDAAPAEKEIWKEWGLDVHYTWYDWSTKDFYPVLTAALKSNPDAVVVTPSAGNSIIKQARELDFKGQFILPDAMPYWWSDVLSPEDIEGLISMSSPDDSPDVPQAYKNYRTNYNDRYNHDLYGPLVWDYYMAPYIAAAALKAAGSTDADKLKEVMESQPLTLEFPGAPMTIRFIGKEYFGVNQRDWYISVVENGKIDQKEVVGPLKQLQYVELINKYEGTAEEDGSEDNVIGPGEDTGGCPDRRLTIDDTIGTLLDCPDTRAILEKHIPDSVTNPALPMFLSLSSLFSLAGDQIDQSKLPLVIEDLNALYGGEPPAVTEEEPAVTGEEPAATEEEEVPPGCEAAKYSLYNDTIATWLDDPEAVAVVQSITPSFDPTTAAQIAEMWTFKDIQPYDTTGEFSDENLAVISAQWPFAMRCE